MVSRPPSTVSPISLEGVDLTPLVEQAVIDAPTPKAHGPRTNQDWWPDQLDLTVLHQHSPLSNPMEPDFDYSKEVESLDVEALRQDLIDLMAYMRTLSDSPAALP